MMYYYGMVLAKHSSIFIYETTYKKNQLNDFLAAYLYDGRCYNGPVSQSKRPLIWKN